MPLAVCRFVTADCNAVISSACAATVAYNAVNRTIQLAHQSVSQPRAVRQHARGMIGAPEVDDIGCCHVTLRFQSSLCNSTTPTTRSATQLAVTQLREQTKPNLQVVVTGRCREQTINAAERKEQESVRTKTASCIQDVCVKLTELRPALLVNRRAVPRQRQRGQTLPQPRTTESSSLKKRNWTQ